MTIQRKNGKLIITIPDNIDVESLKQLINYITYNEVTVKSKAMQDEVNIFSSQINKNWWESNKDKFLNQC